MTTKDAFTPEEWKVVLEGPPTAGMIVVTAARGGSFRESIAMAKAYTEARAEHGESELLDEIVATKPVLDHTRYHSAEELRESGLGHLRNAVALLGSKATAQELSEYRHFVLSLAGKVAAAHREHGQAVSPAEAEAIRQITEALGANGPALGFAHRAAVDPEHRVGPLGGDHVLAVALHPVAEREVVGLRDVPGLPFGEILGRAHHRRDHVVAFVIHREHPDDLAGSLVHLC